jgi:hypothetical protein
LRFLCFSNTTLVFEVFIDKPFDLAQNSFINWCASRISRLPHFFMWMKWIPQSQRRRKGRQLKNVWCWER